MAYVKVLWNRNVVALEKYIFDGRDLDDPLELGGCVEGLVTEQFIGTQMHFGQRGGHSAIHVIQSFGPKDSSRYTPEEFSVLGKKLVEAQFPGHQFCVVTHTDSDKVHNHIMVNPVHAETGRRIHNKTRLLYDLRETSNQICREAGVSIIEGQSQERWRATPEKVREMKRRGGFSWVLDLKEKADFARSIATSFDEYAGVLNQFGIGVRVENKNVVYHYPDKKQKRGDTRGLGAKYSKEGLVEAFKRNYERFFKAGLKSTPVEKVNFEDHWKFHRGAGEYFVPPYRYKDLVVPQSLFRTVQGIDIEKIASEWGVRLATSEDGSRRLSGRDYIKVEGNAWVNEKNHTKGGSLEFLNYIQQESWLHTLQRFDTTGKVGRVLKISPAIRSGYASFYVPRVERKQKESETGLAEFFRAKAWALERLLEPGQVRVGKGGKVKVRPKGCPKISLTLHQRETDWICRSRTGLTGIFFLKVADPSKPMLIFDDPITFLSSGKFLERLANDNGSMTVIVPLKPVDEFLREQKEIVAGHSRVRLIHGNKRLLWGKEESVRQASVGGLDFTMAYESLEELLKDLILGTKTRERRRKSVERQREL